MRNRVLDVLDRTYGAVVEALEDLAEWDDPGTREQQYACDLAADAAAFEVLDAAGFGVFSEERAAYRLDRDIVVAVDPIDGSANAIRGIPYYATSLCAIDDHGMLASLVVNLDRGTRFEAVRGEGARCDGLPLRAGGCSELSAATVALCGMPRERRAWGAMRAFGATALELCDVAQGVLDAYINTDDDVTAPWDYLGALLVCREAGAATADGRGRELVTLVPGERRSPQVAATPALLDEVLDYAWPQAAMSGAEQR